MTESSPAPSAVTTSSYVALPEASGLTSAGAIVWWRLSGELDLTLLAAEWEARGLPAERLPSAPSPKVAFSRTFAEFKEARRLVRPLREGLCVLDEREVDGKLVHRESFRAVLNAVGRPVLTFPEDTSADEREVATGLFVRMYDRILSQIDASDVSPWLCRTMEWLDAVPLRDTGGVYFVPAFVKETCAKVVDALRAASRHAVQSVPAMTTSDAANAFLDAARAEAEAEYATIMTALESGKLGARALQNRVDLSNAVEAKLTRYEDLLGGKLGDVHEKMAELRAALSLAMLSEGSDAAE